MKLVSYTVKGDKKYSAINDSMHLAIEKDGKITPLKNGTGILFPKASFEERNYKGVTKTLRYPYIFKMKEGYGVACVRRNEGKKDSRNKGCICLYTTSDLVNYDFFGFLKVADGEVERPHFAYENDRYYLEFKCGRGLYFAYSDDLRSVYSLNRIKKFRFDEGSCALKDAVVGGKIEITAEQERLLLNKFGVISHIANEEIVHIVERGYKMTMPNVTCVYSDGSKHEKQVDWRFSSGFPTKAGEYTVYGEIKQNHYPFPYVERHMSDPCITVYKNKYYLTHSGSRSVKFRIADSLEGLRVAEEKDVYALPESNKKGDNMWAPEMHIIKGIPYIFTTVGTKKWYTVKCHVLRCKGDPAKMGDWEEPKLVVRPNGKPLNRRGISLDMTYFEDDGKHYVMWSNRVMRGSKGEPADIYIATVNPDEPWKLTSEPYCVIRPIYGWDRLQTEVDEGPFLLRKGSDLFVTVSGSSTAVPELYCLGLLRAKSGKDLLNKDNWEWLPYPVLTKESVEGEKGPGHNCFIKEAGTGNDLMVYHAVPDTPEGKKHGRHMAVRRVHFKADGYPYFEMTEERDVNPELKKVKMKLIIK